jgi:hypothetical protein
MSRKRVLAVVILTAWVPASLVLLDQFGKSYTGVFDPDDRLWSLTSAYTLLESQFGLSKSHATVIHVLDENCACYDQTVQHLQYLSQSMPDGVEQIFQSVSDMQQLGIDVPATPMIILMNEGQLNYAGPYATGPLCTAQTDILLPIVKGDVLLSGPWLNSAAVSCRCRVEA